MSSRTAPAGYAAAAATNSPRLSLTCPSCRAVSALPALGQSYNSYLYACPSCDLHFWSPVTMPDASWYEAAYRGRDRTAMPLEPGHLFFLSDSKAPKTGTLLDVGCGVGNFLAAARDAGFTVTGVEPDPTAVRFAREHYNLENVHALRPSEFRDSLAPKKFDIVTFFEVLEHQDDPQTFIEVAKDCLAENGWIAMSVPNRNRWQVGTDANDLPPNHLTRWSPAAIEKFLARNGFEIVSLREEPLTVRRASQMLSVALTTGAAARIAGRPSATIADLAAMSREDLHRTVTRAETDPKFRLVERLARLKQAAIFPAAAVLLPWFRLRGHTGLYLYCLARRKSATAPADSRSASASQASA